MVASEAESLDRISGVFRRQWENCGFEDQQFMDLWAFAHNTSESLPYHNFIHAIETLWASMELVDQLETDGFAVNRRVLAGTALLHNARRRLHPANPLERTLHSARIFGRHALKFGYSEEEVSLGKKTIMESSHLKRSRGSESKVLIRANLDGVTGSFKRMEQTYMRR